MKIQAVGTANYNQKSPAFGNIKGRAWNVLLAEIPEAMDKLVTSAPVRTIAKDFDVIVKPSDVGNITLSFMPKSFIGKIWARFIMRHEPHMSISYEQDTDCARKILGLTHSELRRVAYGRAYFNNILPSPRKTSQKLIYSDESKKTFLSDLKVINNIINGKYGL